MGATMIKLTMKQAKQLYIDAGGPDDHGDEEWADIQKEMEAILNAPTDFKAGQLIQWWGCWDRKLTATAFARRIRESWFARESKA